jgi:hypothetical protein
VKPSQARESVRGVPAEMSGPSSKEMKQTRSAMARVARPSQLISVLGIR